MKDFSYTGYYHGHLEASRRLRSKMTPQEKKLWYDFLKTYPVHCYKQRSIDRFIVDFYLPEARLIIELDGLQHYTINGERYDHLRTDILSLYKLNVVRFTNEQIDQNFGDVCAIIDKAVKKQESLII